MALPTISAGDLLNKGTTGMPANPELSAADLQAKFDELSIDVLVPKFQALVTALENASAGADLGVTAPTGITASNKVKSVLDAMSVILLTLKNKSDVSYDSLVSIFTGIVSVVDIVDGDMRTIPNCKAIADYVQDMGGGDMVKTVYDTNNNGIVDNSERLGNQVPTYYAKQTDLNATNQALDTAVEDILDITPTKKEITWASGNTPITSLCYKVGNLVHIDFKMPITTGITNNEEVVGIVPVDCRPAVSIVYSATGHANRVASATYNDNFGILCGVTAGGNIHIANDFGIEMFGACVSIEYFIS